MKIFFLYIYQNKKKKKRKFCVFFLKRKQKQKTKNKNKNTTNTKFVCSRKMLNTLSQRRRQRKQKLNQKYKTVRTKDVRIHKEDSVTATKEEERTKSFHKDGTDRKERHTKEKKERTAESKEIKRDKTFSKHSLATIDDLFNMDVEQHIKYIENITSQLRHDEVVSLPASQPPALNNNLEIKEEKNQESRQVEEFKEFKDEKKKKKKKKKKKEKQEEEKNDDDDNEEEHEIGLYELTPQVQKLCALSLKLGQLQTSHKYDSYSHDTKPTRKPNYTTEEEEDTVRRKHEITVLQPMQLHYKTMVWEKLTWLPDVHLIVWPNWLYELWKRHPTLRLAGGAVLAKLYAVRNLVYNNQKKKWMDERKWDHAHTNNGKTPVRLMDVLKYRDTRDYDFFPIGDTWTPDKIIQAAQDIAFLLRQENVDMEYTVISTPTCVNVVARAKIQAADGPPRRVGRSYLGTEAKGNSPGSQECVVQIILRTTPTTSKVLHGFDRGASAFALTFDNYKRPRILFTACALFLLRWDADLHKLTLFRGSHPYRAYKYFEYNIPMAMPHLDSPRVQIELQEHMNAITQKKSSDRRYDNTEMFKLCLPGFGAHVLPSYEHELPSLLRIVAIHPQHYVHEQVARKKAGDPYALLLQNACASIVSLCGYEFNKNMFINKLTRESSCYFNFYNIWLARIAQTMLTQEDEDIEKKTQDKDSNDNDSTNSGGSDESDQSDSNNNQTSTHKNSRTSKNKQDQKVRSKLPNKCLRRKESKEIKKDESEDDAIEPNETESDTRESAGDSTKKINPEQEQEQDQRDKKEARNNKKKLRIPRFEFHQILCCENNPKFTSIQTDWVTFSGWLLKKLQCDKIDIRLARIPQFSSLLHNYRPPTLETCAKALEKIQTMFKIDPFIRACIKPLELTTLPTPYVNLDPQIWYGKYYKA